MIRLSSTEQVWESQEYQHPEQSGGSYLPYTLNHNFGRCPDLVKCYLKVDGIWSVYESIQDSYNTGIWITNSPDNNNAKVLVFRIAPGTFTIKFKCFLRS